MKNKSQITEEKDRDKDYELDQKIKGVDKNVKN